jgi:ketosteroid isomerase-like protein
MGVMRSEMCVSALVVAGAMGMSLGGCASPGSAHAVKAVDIAAESAELLKVDAAWAATIATRDAAVVGAYFTDDVEIYPPGSPALIGKSAATAMWAHMFTDPAFSLSWKATDAHVATAGDLGMTTGGFEITFSGPGGEKMAHGGKFVCIWTRQPDGTWKVYRDMWNADAR